MTTLGIYNHDFPRLAKQSGFFFQLHRGRVNWSEIENLNIDDIIEHRHFELLEQNLLNVVNCNLEREYDLKILDQNFVKLFKLAQLGVDYLSYCEIYLDRCVVLLQEQLISVQEELKTLKAENEKRTEDSKKSKKRTKAQNYQCEKCEKAFISEVYLKFHDKRRHSNPSTPKSLENITISQVVDTSQQTEDKKTHTTSTQTIDFELGSSHTPQNKEDSIIKKENNEKIENLEKELTDLKIRLKKAENTLTEVPNSSLPSSMNFAAPIFYPPMLPFVPSYYTQPTCCHDANVGYSTVVPEQRQTSNTNSDAVISDPVCVSNEAQTQESCIEKQFGKNSSEDKENFDPKISQVKPLPLPRKKNQNSEVQKVAEQYPVISNIQSEPNFIQSVPRTSTPIKEKEVESQQPTVKPNEIESNESYSNEMVSVKPKNKSFFKKIVSRNSPKLKELSHNLKRSLTNLYDSVSSKESVKNVDDLNDQLRELGIDPEWVGIPKKTMKQKLKALKHRRKLLTKENPTYPIIRKNIEKKVFQKLHIGVKRNSNSNKINEQESIETQEPAKPPDVPQVLPSQTKPVMYNVDTESETELSGSENIGNENPPQEVPIQRAAFVGMSSDDSEPEIVGAEEKEFDFSVFQVNKESTKNVVEKKAEVLVEDVQTDSDFDDDFLEEYIEKRNKETESPEAEKDKTESILKSGQFKTEVNAKKKVLFMDDFSEVEVEEKKEDDLWSIQSDWESELRLDNKKI